MADRHDVQLRTQLLEKILPSVNTVDNLDSDNSNRPLSARQGKVLKEIIKTSIGESSTLSIEVVNSLPAVGTKGILYLVPKTSYLKEKNIYDEYIWIESSSKYEMLGSFSTDLNIEEYVNKFNSVLGEIQEINVATLEDYGINFYTTTGTYRVYGERINNADGLPIINAANGHTVEGILKVLNSGISGSGKPTDKVVTQVLTMSNRLGGDGHIWIRTGQGTSDQGLTWSTWEKLQGIFEKNIITTDPLEALNSFTTNGMYSGIFVQPFSVNIVDGSYHITTASQFLVITNNGYALASPEIGGNTPVIMQMIFLLYDGRSVSFNRTGTWDGASWVYNKIRISSNISVNSEGILRTIDSNGALKSTIGSGAVIRGGSYIGSSSRIDDFIKLTYSGGILTITAGDGKKAVITLS